MALINIPFFPNPLNIFSSGVCTGIGFVVIATAYLRRDK
jgi:hypothetical protein